VGGLGAETGKGIGDGHRGRDMEDQGGCVQGGSSKDGHVHCPPAAALRHALWWLARASADCDALTQGCSPVH
jgi:hypothetical protein